MDEWRRERQLPCDTKTAKGMAVLADARVAFQARYTCVPVPYLHIGAPAPVLMKTLVINSLELAFRHGQVETSLAGAFNRILILCSGCPSRYDDSRDLELSLSRHR